MFVDESGCTDLRSGPYFVISGIIVNESDLDFISQQISNFKSQYFINEYTNGEIHIHHIWAGKRPFEKVDKTTKILLLNNLYSLLYQLPFSVISVVIDKKLMLSGDYVNWNVTKASWAFLTERFDMHISDNNNSNTKGLLIVDKQTKQVDNEIRDRVNDLRLNGSYYYKNGPYYYKYKHLFEEPLFVPSYDRIGLQIADAISFCTLKHFCLIKDFEYYWNCIVPKYRRNPNTNNINGFGLKIYPKESETI